MECYFDQEGVRIYPYLDSVVVEKYAIEEVSGSLQKSLCDHITSFYGLKRNGIVLKSCRYSLSADAMMHLRNFMTSYQGSFCYADPSVTTGISEYANSAYLNRKSMGVYPTLEAAYAPFNRVPHTA